MSKVFSLYNCLPSPPLPSLSPKPNCSLNPSCRDTYESGNIIPKYWGAGVHQDDILCLNHQEPNFLASGGYDGEIAVWNMDVEKPVCRLNASSLTGAAAGGGSLTGAAAGGGSQQSQPPQDLCTGDGHCGGEEDGDCDGERGGEEKSAREAGAKRRRGKDERAVEKVRKYTQTYSIAPKEEYLATFVARILSPPHSSPYFLHTVKPRRREPGNEISTKPQ